MSSEGHGMALAKRWKVLQLVVYTMSTMVFGMICSALGPSIPWLASNADVEPETLGWLPAAQAVMCIVSGLASSLTTFVPRRFHHCLLCGLMMWLGLFFMVLPLASTGGIYALALVFAFQVLPRPWIGQMTNLLVSYLFDDASLSSAAQSFNQGGFALGCVFMVLLEEFSSSFGGEMMFYIAGGFTGLSSLLFLILPKAKDEERKVESTTKSTRNAPSAFTLSCACLGILAVGLEVACGTWLITAMLQLGFTSYLPSLCNIVFWALFAVSRLVLAPCLCKCFRLKPSAMIIGGASVAALSCLPATMYPQLPALLLAISGIALGVGPAYAMTITMAKERQDLTSVDSAMFAIASSLGAGGVPFLMSRMMSFFGPHAFIPTLFGMSLALLVMTGLLQRASHPRKDFMKDVEAESEVTNASDLSDAVESFDVEEPNMPVPPVIWTYWEQGWESAPLVCQICIESWESANPELTIHKLSAADIPVLLPDLCSWSRFWELPPGQRSDLVRLALLKEFGGIWVDATLFASGPIMPWLESLRPSDSDGFFFVFQRDSETWPYDPFLECKLPISSWFIASSANHPMISKWFSSLCREVMSSSISYFVIHEAFRKLLEEDSEMAELYRQMTKVSARHPHILEFELNFSGETHQADVLSRSLAAAPMQKLSHKVLHDQLLMMLLNPELPTLLGALFSHSELAERLRHGHDFHDACRSEFVAAEKHSKAAAIFSWRFSMQFPLEKSNLSQSQ